MEYSSFEKSIYKSLYERFANKEHHVTYIKSEYDDDFEELRKALNHLSDGGILLLLADETDELCAELTPKYCYKLASL
ncbi:MAG: hypothetical protein EOM28_09510 [Clostridia bacterium]|nr:hypothetical protein [Clostridia bacterium]